jgi:hypothetical protein
VACDRGCEGSVGNLIIGLRSLWLACEVRPPSCGYELLYGELGSLVGVWGGGFFST